MTLPPEPPPGPRLVPTRRGRTAPSSRKAPPASPIHPFDALHGTDTGGLIPGADLRTGDDSDRFITAYYAVAPSIFRAVLDLWQHQTAPPLPLDRYTLVDIGAGKGRAMLLAAENPFVAVWAVERNPGLASIARDNLARARSAAATDLLAPIEILEADALTLPLPATPAVLFLFHPFEAPAMRRLLGSIATQFASRPRELDLLYVNAEHAAAIERDARFTRLWSGRVPMSPEDHLADLQEIAGQVEYGSTGDEVCAIYRFIGALDAAAT